MKKPIDFEIAWASQADVPVLVSLFSMLYQHEVPEAPKPSNEAITSHIYQLIDPDTPHKLVVAKSKSGAAVGLAGVGFFVSISDPRPERRVQMELKELFVLPEHRSGGIGAAIMKWIEERALSKNACRIDWHVRRENTAGISFYRRFGGNVVEDRISMRKYLFDER